MLNEEAKDNLESRQATDMAESLNQDIDEEETKKGNWRETLRTAFARAPRRQQKPAARRQDLGQDKSKAFFRRAAAVLRRIFHSHETHSASGRDAARPI